MSEKYQQFMAELKVLCDKHNVGFFYHDYYDNEIALVNKENANVDFDQAIADLINADLPKYL